MAVADLLSTLRLVAGVAGHHLRGQREAPRRPPARSPPARSPGACRGCSRTAACRRTAGRSRSRSRSGRRAGRRSGRRTASPSAPAETRRTPAWDRQRCSVWPPSTAAGRPSRSAMALCRTSAGAAASRCPDRPAGSTLPSLMRLLASHEHGPEACLNAPPRQGPRSALQPDRRNGKQHKQAITGPRPAEVQRNQSKTP